MNWVCGHNVLPFFGNASWPLVYKVNDHVGFSHALLRVKSHINDTSYQQPSIQNLHI